MPTDAQKRDSGPIFDFPVVPQPTLGATFSAKKVLKDFDGLPGERSWSGPGRDLAPKTLQRRIFVDLGSFSVRFWKDSKQMLERLSTYFECDC